MQTTDELRNDRDELLDKLGRVCALVWPKVSPHDTDDAPPSADHVSLIATICRADDRIVAVGDSYLDHRNKPYIDLIEAVTAGAV